VDEGANEFKELKSIEWVGDDLKEVRFAADNGSSATPVDVRFHEVSVRGPEVPAAAQVAEVEAPPPSRRRLLWLAAAVAAAAFLLAGGVGLWLGLLRKRTPPTKPAPAKPRPSPPK
jgi:hypothetical protein